MSNIEKFETTTTTTSPLTPEELMAKLIKEQQDQLIADQQGLIKDNVNKMLSGMFNDFINGLKQVPIFNRALDELSTQRIGLFTIIVLLILGIVFVFFVPWMMIIILNLILTFLLIFLNTTKCKKN